MRDICLIQHRGDKAAADALLAEHGKITPPLEHALARLGTIPVDIEPRFVTAAELSPEP